MPDVVRSPLQSKQGVRDGAPAGDSPQDAGGETPDAGRMIAEALDGLETGKTRPTFEDYNRERSVYAAEHPTHREGQVAFNVLQDMRSDLTIHAYGNYFDPYYVDTLLPEFLEWVEANWEKKT